MFSQEYFLSILGPVSVGIITAATVGIARRIAMDYYNTDEDARYQELLREIEERLPEIEEDLNLSEEHGESCYRSMSIRERLEAWRRDPSLIEDRIPFLERLLQKTRETSSYATRGSTLETLSAMRTEQGSSSASPREEYMALVHDVEVEGQTDIGNGQQGKPQTQKEDKAENREEKILQMVPDDISEEVQEEIPENVLNEISEAMLEMAFRRVLYDVSEEVLNEQLAKREERAEEVLGEEAADEVLEVEEGVEEVAEKEIAKNVVEVVYDEEDESQTGTGNMQQEEQQQTQQEAEDKKRQKKFLEILKDISKAVEKPESAPKELAEEVLETILEKVLRDVSEEVLNELITKMKLQEERAGEVLELQAAEAVSETQIVKTVPAMGEIEGFLKEMLAKKRLREDTKEEFLWFGSVLGTDVVKIMPAIGLVEAYVKDILADVSVMKEIAQNALEETNKEALGKKVAEEGTLLKTVKHMIAAKFVKAIEGKAPQKLKVEKVPLEIRFMNWEASRKMAVEEAPEEMLQFRYQTEKVLREKIEKVLSRERERKEEEMPKLPVKLRKNLEIEDGKIQTQQIENPEIISKGVLQKNKEEEMNI